MIDGLGLARTRSASGSGGRRLGSARRLAALSLCCLWACTGPRLATDSPSGGPPVFDFAAVDAGAPAYPARVILVSVAGLSADHYRPSRGSMPTLAALARAGVAAQRVDGVAPPAAYPVHTTLVTGRPPSDHGIVADRLLGERGVRSERASHASLIRGPTLWQQIDAARGGAGALDWPATVGASLPILFPDLMPLRGQPYGARLVGSTTPWILELATRTQAEIGAPGPGRDAFIAAAACVALGSQAAPRLLLVRFTQTEPVLQERGPETPEAEAAFARVDAELARLVSCLEAAQRLESAALVVVGDRTFEPAHTAIRANRVLREGGLLGVQDDGIVAAWRAVARSNGGSAFVYARDAGSAVEARRVLSQQAEGSGAFRVVSAEEMIARAADPEAWFGLEARPGFVFVDAALGPALAPAPVRGAGGHLDEAGSPGFVAFGVGLRRGLRVPSMSQLDVAPTLAVLLGVELPETAGRALVGLLRLPRGAASEPVRGAGEVAESVESPVEP